MDVEHGAKVVAMGGEGRLFSHGGADFVPRVLALGFIRDSGRPD